MSSAKGARFLGVLTYDLTNNKVNNKSIARDYRDKALILIGFLGGFRRSELVSIDYSDVEFVEEGVKIFITEKKSQIMIFDKEK